MKREYRLLKKDDFKKVLDKRQSVSRENMSIHYLINNERHCRVGISVSSKIGNSVVRHKIKRQVNSMMESVLDKNAPLDIVVIVRKRYLDNSYSENNIVLKNAIKYILKRGEL